MVDSWTSSLVACVQRPPVILDHKKVKPFLLWDCTLHINELLHTSAAQPPSSFL